MDKLPVTFEEAIEKLKTDLGPEELEKLRQFVRNDLIKLHFGLAMDIRNSYGLWGGNDALSQDIADRMGGAAHVDDMSHFLIESLWEMLQDNSDESDDNQ